MKYKGTQKYSSIIHLDTLLVFYVRSSDIRKPGRGFYTMQNISLQMM